jgi:RNA polymerase sigma-70 factor (sigma-E family)
MGVEATLDFETYVRARTPALLRAAILLTGDQHLAEDLVQSALARTHLHWAKLARQGHAEAYTRKIMYNLQVSFWRRRRFTENVTAGPPHTALADGTEHAAIRLTLERALRRLSPKQRAVLVLRFYEDQTEPQAARLLGVSVGTVKSQTAKALAKLRTISPELAAFDPKEASQ